MNRLKFNLLSKLYVLAYLELLFVIYVEYKREVLRKSVMDLIETKRSAEYDLLITTLRPNICLVVEKDCCYKIFNKLIEKIGNDSKPIFIYSMKDRMIQIGEKYVDSKVTYYILSPYIKPNHEYTCCHCLDIIKNYMNATLVNIYFNILNKLMASGRSRYDLEEVHYSVTKYSGMDVYTFDIEELGRIRFTKCFQRNLIMEQVNDITNRLCSMRKYEITKAEWSTKAVDMLMEMLLERNILKKEVCLEEYPEIIPLLFPFKFIETADEYWNRVNLVSIGVDLREIEGNELAGFFNIEMVREFCVAGGLYISSRAF